MSASHAAARRARRSAGIDFYVQALGARELVRYLSPRTGAISHADLVLGGSPLSVTEEARAWNSDSPESLGGSSVVLQLWTDDVAALLERACRQGATVVFPLTSFCGERMARVRDPFGHLWILSTVLEELSPAEKQRRRETFGR
jgi:PhnB protein